MATQEEALGLFAEIETFLASLIENNKCVLIVGARNSGKTCLIKFFSGAAFTRDTNEQDLPFLVENPDVVPASQPTIFKSQKISLELTVLRVNDPNTGEEVAIIEMPSFMSLSSPEEAQKDITTIFHGVLFKIFTWSTVLNLAKQIHICLINPYEFITDDHKLIEFFTVWENSITANEQAREKIKECVSIIFTKPQYEDDKESLVTSLEHLSQAGYEGIGENNTFFNATQENRVYCFLSQDTEQGQGQELVNSILGSAAYYPYTKENIFLQEWDQNFIWNFIKGLGDQKYKEVFKLVEKMFKKFLGSDQTCGKVFSKSLAVLGNATTLSLIKSLPKQSVLKKKQKQIENEIKLKIKEEPIINPEVISKVQQSVEKTEKYIELLVNLNNLIQSASKTEILIEELIKKAQQLYWDHFKIEEEARKVISHWIDQKLSLWKFTSSFYRLCHKHKESHQLQADAHMLEQLNKELTKKFASLLKSKITSGLGHYEVVAKLGQLKSIAQNAAFKQILPIYGAGDGDEVVEEQEEVPSDPRIKRLYYKTEQNQDLYASIKEKAKKIVAKPLPKGQQINQRENIKNLLGLIERQPENRNQNLQVLAKKLIEFKFYQEALQVYLDLADPFKLYSYLTESYFDYLDEKPKESHFEYLKSVVIPYLQQKCTIYSQVSSAQQFLYAVQACYDFLAVKFAENGQEFAQMMTLSNQIQRPSQENAMNLEILTDPDSTLESSFISNQNKDMEFLKFATFSKAEIIAKIHDRDQKTKKNGLLFTTIRKHLEAARIELKAK